MHLDPRLKAAADMLSGARVIADVGCDHGRLIAALLQADGNTRCIGVDVSGPSLEKARALLQKTGLSARATLRQGDGFLPLVPGEADAAALLGMGGTLMTRMLETCTVPFQGARRVVFQPMHMAEDIRAYLYAHGCTIADDRVVVNAGRFYQVFAALPPSGAREDLPEGWPVDCFTVGYRAFAKRDPLLPALAERRIRQCEKRLETSSAEKLVREVAQMRQILGVYAAGR